MAWSLVQSASNKATVAGNTATVTLPGGATAGNLLIAVVNSNFIPSTPTGFGLDNNAINFTACYTFSKIAAGGETAVSSTFAGSASWAAVVEEWSGNAASTPLDKVASNSTQTATTLATGTTAALSAATDLAIYCFGSPAADIPNSLSNGVQDYAFNATDGTNVTLAVAHQALASSAGASATWGFNAGPANLIGSVTTYKAGTPNFPRSLSDSVAVSEALARSGLTLTRATADSLAVSEALARSGLTLARGAADSLAVSEALVRSAQSLPRPLADSLTLTDVLTRGARVLTRGLADTWTISESITVHTSTTVRLSNPRQLASRWPTPRRTTSRWPTPRHIPN